MADPAKYLVTVAPGAPVVNVGFVKPGEVFTAPSEDYVPSRTFRPANAAAKAVLEKVYAAEKERLENARKEDVKTQLGMQLAQLEADRKSRLDLYDAPKSEPKVTQELSLAELGALEARSQQPPGDVPPLDQNPAQNTPQNPPQNPVPTPAQAKAQAKADRAADK